MIGHGIALAAGADDKGKPLFVSAGTKIDAALRAKAGDRPILAEPSGYPVFLFDLDRLADARSGDARGVPLARLRLRGWAC